MISIKIITVGRLKEKYWRDAAAEYEKRLSRYCRLQIIEVQDEKTPDHAGEKENRQILEREGERILPHIRENTFCVILAIKGKSFTSEGLARCLSDCMTRGISDITFVIGGSLGLAPEVEKRGHLKLSFSELTFPHQLMRILLLEQVYRCFRIIHCEPYHK